MFLRGLRLKLLDLPVLRAHLVKVLAVFGNLEHLLVFLLLLLSRISLHALNDEPRLFLQILSGRQELFVIEVELVRTELGHLVLRTPSQVFHSVVLSFL